jgi:hypothetical protein
MKVGTAGGPHARATMQVMDCLGSVTGAQLERHGQFRRAVEGFDSAQHDDPVGITRECNCLATFYDPGVGDPAAAPDHRPFLVGAAPYVSFRRRDRVLARPADE